MNTTSNMLELRVRSISRLAQDIHSVVFESLTGESLPPADAGSHVDVHLTDRLARSYSVVVDARHPSRYEIAVAKAPNSRGGSRYVHETLRVGDIVKVGEPRNAFPLEEAAEASLLLAGGIGITPMWSMVQRLEHLRRPWQLYYCARSRAHAAYLEDILALESGSSCGTVHLHFDDEAGGPPNVASFVERAPATAHLYCCGPQPMLDAFGQATRERQPERVHTESFGSETAPGNGDGFSVYLAKTGCELMIPADKSILDILLDHSVDIQFGCMQGVCGVCEVRVLDGEPDHGGPMAASAALGGNDKMLVCCSRSKSPKLTLDL